MYHLFWLLKIITVSKNLSPWLYFSTVSKVFPEIIYLLSDYDVLVWQIAITILTAVSSAINSQVRFLLLRTVIPNSYIHGK